MREKRVYVRFPPLRSRGNAFLKLVYLLGLLYYGILINSYENLADTHLSVRFPNTVEICKHKVRSQSDRLRYPNLTRGGNSWPHDSRVMLETLRNSFVPNSFICMVFEVRRQPRKFRIQFLLPQPRQHSRRIHTPHCNVFWNRYV